MLDLNVKSKKRSKAPSQVSDTSAVKPMSETKLELKSEKPLFLNSKLLILGQNTDINNFK